MTEQTKSRLKGPVTGVEIGRMVIQDMCNNWVYQNKLQQGTAPAKPPVPLLPDSRLHPLLAGLRTVEDIEQYQHYREMHNLLAQIPARFSGYRLIVTSNLWSLSAHIQEMQMGEVGNLYAYLRETPIAPWQELLFPDHGAPNFVVNRGPGFPPRLREAQNSLRRLFAIRESLSIIADCVDVPAVKEIVQEEIPEKVITDYNNMAMRSDAAIVRPCDPADEARLRAAFRAIAVPIDIEAAKPKPAQITEARAYAQVLERVYQDYNAFLEILYREVP